MRIAQPSRAHKALCASVGVCECAHANSLAMKRLILIFFGFYFLTLIQTSFLIHFKALFGWQAGFGLILIAVILINLFESPSKNGGIFSALFGGFFLDIFSENFIGFWILISIAIALFIKFIFKKYVRIPILRRV